MMEPATDREFILDQENWPRWPVLPLKRPRWEGAFLAGPDLTRHLREGAPIRLVVRWGADWKPLDYQEYADVDALLADGWVVD